MNTALRCHFAHTLELCLVGLTEDYAYLSVVLKHGFMFVLVAVASTSWLKHICQCRDQLKEISLTVLFPL